MGSSLTRKPFSPSSLFRKPENSSIQSRPSYLQLNPAKTLSKNQSIMACTLDPTPRKQNPQRFSLSCLATNQHLTAQALSVSEKVQSLDFEFKSLPEPIDRVKRLLRYATLLPPFDESSRIQENRVLGCTAQVWLEVEMDGNGVVTFRVDSDSEITKGFCSCLIWALDGAEAEEVLRVTTDDLAKMNVGLPSRGSSRVNTWHNVLISMQRRTKDLAEERDRQNYQSLEALVSLAAVNGSCKETQVHRNAKLESSFGSQYS